MVLPSHQISGRFMFFTGGVIWSGYQISKVTPWDPESSTLSSRIPVRMMNQWTSLNLWRLQQSLSPNGNIPVNQHWIRQIQNWDVRQISHFKTVFNIFEFPLQSNFENLKNYPSLYRGQVLRNLEIILTFVARPINAFTNLSY